MNSNAVKRIKSKHLRIQNLRPSTPEMLTNPATNAESDIKMDKAARVSDQPPVDEQPAQPEPSTAADGNCVSSLNINTIPIDIQYEIAKKLDVFDLARLVTALGEPFEVAGSLLLESMCRHFIAYPFSESEQIKCLRNNYSVLSVAAHHIKEMTLTYSTMKRSTRTFNKMLRSLPIPHLRRLNITQIVDEYDLSCPIPLHPGMEFPIFFGLERLTFSRFASVQLMCEIIEVNSATLLELEFDGVRELDDLPPLPEFLNRLVIRGVHTVDMDKLVHSLTYDVTHKGLTHFEYTTAVSAISCRQNTPIQFRKLFDAVRATVQSMTLDAWLLPYALDKRNKVVRQLVVHLTKLTPHLEETLDCVAAQMTGLEHLTLTCDHPVAMFSSDVDQYANLFDRLKSVTLINCTFVGDKFLRFVESRTRLTVHNDHHMEMPTDAPIEEEEELQFFPLLPFFRNNMLALEI